MSSCSVVVPGPDVAASGLGRVLLSLFKMSWLLTGVVGWSLMSYSDDSFVVSVVSCVCGAMMSVMVSHCLCLSDEVGNDPLGGSRAATGSEG